jgi:hypothetical protein
MEDPFTKKIEEAQAQKQNLLLQLEYAEKHLALLHDMRRRAAAGTTSGAPPDKGAPNQQAASALHGVAVGSKRSRPDPPSLGASDHAHSSDGAPASPPSEAPAADRSDRATMAQAAGVGVERLDPTVSTPHEWHVAPVSAPDAAPAALPGASDAAAAPAQATPAVILAEVPGAQHSSSPGTGALAASSTAPRAAPTQPASAPALAASAICNTPADRQLVRERARSVRQLLLASAGGVIELPIRLHPDTAQVPHATPLAARFLMAVKERTVYYDIALTMKEGEVKEYLLPRSIEIRLQFIKNPNEKAAVDHILEYEGCPLKEVCQHSQLKAKLRSNLSVRLCSRLGRTRYR